MTGDRTRPHQEQESAKPAALILASPTSGMGIHRGRCFAHHELAPFERTLLESNQERHGYHQAFQSAAKQGRSPQTAWPGTSNSPAHTHSFHPEHGLGRPEIARSPPVRQQRFHSARSNAGDTSDWSDAPAGGARHGTHSADNVKPSPIAIRALNGAGYPAPPHLNFKPGTHYRMSKATWAASNGTKTPGLSDFRQDRWGVNTSPNWGLLAFGQFRSNTNVVGERLCLGQVATANLRESQTRRLSLFVRLGWQKRSHPMFEQIPPNDWSMPTDPCVLSLGTRNRIPGSVRY